VEEVRTPALLPALALAAGIVAVRALALPPATGAAAALLALGVALGRRAGTGLAAAALGVLAARVAEPHGAELRPGRSTVIVGEVCGAVESRHDRLAVPLCASLARQGSAIRLEAFVLRLGLVEGRPPPAFGERLRVRGLLTRSAGFANEAEVPPGPWRLRLKSAVFVESIAPPSLGARAAGRLRDGLRRVYDRPAWTTRPGVALTRSLVLGDAAALGEPRRRALRRCGLAHLVAVSGFNVSVVAALAAAAASALPRRVRLSAAGATVLVHLAAVGTSASVLRASGMALLAIAALSLARPPRARQAWALAFGALLAARPELVSQPGFQLSFAATAGLLTLAPRWAEHWSARLPRLAALALAAALAAQVAALPWSVAAFGDVAPLGVALNLVAVPWASAALLLGWCWTLAAMLAPPLAAASLPALDALAGPLALLERLPPSGWISSAWPGGLGAGLLLSVAAAIAVDGGRRGRALLVGTLALVQTGGGAPAPERFEAFFVDVGQGDATLLVAGRRALLVDGGGSPGFDLGGRVLRPLLARRGLARLEAAVVTHTDSDHCLGLLDLAAYVPIEEVWAPRGSEDDACVRGLRGAARRGARFLRAGDRLRAAGFELLVLHPAGDAGGADNRRSLVLRASAGGRRLLLAGDVGGAEESALVSAWGGALRADLLRVAHHGSASSSTPGFVAEVAPRLAVFSAGVDDPYGHPSPLALTRVAAVAPVVLRTDRDGGISVGWSAGSPLRIGLPGSPRRRRPEK
jgi:competence protein ComEC